MSYARREFDARKYLEWLLEVRARGHSDSAKTMLEDFFLRGLNFASLSLHPEIEFYQWLDLHKCDNGKHGWVIVDEAGNFWSGPNRDMFSAPPSDAIVLTCKEDAEKIRSHMLKRSDGLRVREFRKDELCDGPKSGG